MWSSPIRRMLHDVKNVLKTEKHIDEYTGNIQYIYNINNINHVGAIVVLLCYICKCLGILLLWIFRLFIRWRRYLDVSYHVLQVMTHGWWHGWRHRVMTYGWWHPGNDLRNTALAGIAASALRHRICERLCERLCEMHCGRLYEGPARWMPYR